MINQTIFAQGDYRWYMFGRDKKTSQKVIDTNEYLIVNGDKAILLDPGGTEVFPSVVAAISEIIDVGMIDTFFCSHQDPDVMSSLPLWMGLCPQAKIYLPAMWSGFIAHYGHEYVDNFVPVKDEGTSISVGSKLDCLEMIPAHYCHSSGNFSLYDPNAKILYTGDIGAALLPEDNSYLKVTDFQDHTRYMEPFHKRWMPSSKALKIWAQRVRKLEVNILCPQHGALMEGEDVERFLNWLEPLEVGSALQANR